MFERHIAYAEESGMPGIAFLPHRLPNLSVRIAPLVAGSRPMQHEAVDVVCAEMLQRTDYRLRDLSRERRRWIVRQAMILPALVSEFGLQKEIRARHHARTIGSSEPFADSGLEVMPPLVGRVDRPKPRAQREFREFCGAGFLPGSAVNKVGER